jgi:hypothetical protein
MTASKIEIKIGEITFASEGEQDWVAKQLDKVLGQAVKLIQLAPAPVANEGAAKVHKQMESDAGTPKKPLPAFLQEKNATRNQVRKFLATAAWLESKGQNRVATADVTKALKDANQTRLANPADCLNKNVAKGFCEKEGKQFFVTDEGKASL